jgi:hypothetical protein
MVDMVEPQKKKKGPAGWLGQLRELGPAGVAAAKQLEEDMPSEGTPWSCAWGPQWWGQHSRQIAGSPAAMPSLKECEKKDVGVLGKALFHVYRAKVGPRGQACAQLWHANFKHSAAPPPVPRVSPSHSGASSALRRPSRWAGALGGA